MKVLAFNYIVIHRSDFIDLRRNFDADILVILMLIPGINLVKVLVYVLGRSTAHKVHTEASWILRTYLLANRTGPEETTGEWASGTTMYSYE